MALCILAIQGCVRDVPNNEISEQVMSIYANARSNYMKGDFALAAELLMSLTQHKPPIPQVAFLLAKTRFMQEEMREAEELFENIITASPEHGDARLWLARTKIALNEHIEAVEILTHSLQWNGEDPRVNSLMGDCQRILGETDNAIDFYQRAVLFEDELTKIYLSLASIYNRYRLSDREEYYVEKAESLVSTDSLFYEAVKSARKSIEE